MMVFEVRHWISNHEAGIRAERQGGNTVGNIFYGSKGYLAIDGYGDYKSLLGKEQQPGPSKNEEGDNWANFIAAVRSRNYSDLNAPIEEGALSCNLVHYANISYRLGRSLQIDPATGNVVGDDEAQRMFTRKYRAP